jgi:hypothetical protein
LTPSLAWGIVGVLHPAFILPLYVVWMALVWPLGWLVSHALLAIAYFFVLTPIALIVRWRRGDPLRRAFDRDAASYWTPRPGTTPVERYFRQF